MSHILLWDTVLRDTLFGGCRGGSVVKHWLLFQRNLAQFSTGAEGNHRNWPGLLYSLLLTYQNEPITNSRSLRSERKIQRDQKKKIKSSMKKRRQIKENIG